MAGEYSANVDEIRASSAHIDAACRKSEEMGPTFEAGWNLTAGWWGQEGDDQFADQVGPQCREEFARVSQTINDITGGFLALVGAVAAEAVNVQRPQTEALDDIQALDTESETRR
ncbi:hypothetical protein ACFW2X_24035 [Streptomyces antibioticus]|uniref:hypothetical protein n=1 Tax=Streptomyces antibioticus TaxID=1890 RepID=UPI0036C583BA